MRLCGIHLRTISQTVRKLFFSMNYLKIILWNYFCPSYGQKAKIAIVDNQHYCEKNIITDEPTHCRHPHISIGHNETHVYVWLRWYSSHSRCVPMSWRQIDGVRTSASIMMTWIDRRISEVARKQCPNSQWWVSFAPFIYHVYYHGLTKIRTMDK